MDRMQIQRGISMGPHIGTLHRVTRRRLLQLTGLAATAASIGFPGRVRARTQELVIGGAGGHTGWMKESVIPLFEQKYGAKILFEGTKSTVNLEKMRSTRDKPYLSVVMMDDPVLIIAVEEKLLEPLSPATVPNLAAIKPQAVHLEGMWANYQQPWCGIGYNTQQVKQGVGSWAALWDPAYKGKVITPESYVLMLFGRTWPVIASKKRWNHRHP